MQKKKIIEQVNKFKECVLDALFPRNIKCIFCGEELNEKAHNCTCEECYPTLPFINKCCDRCGSPVNPENIGVCMNCKTNNFHFEIGRSVFGYSDNVVYVVQNLKYNCKKYLVEPMVNFMLEKFATLNIFTDIITCIPMFKTKLKKRGYNQSALLASAFANKLNLPFIELCEKVVDNPSQTSLSYTERRNNVKDCYKLKKEFAKTIKGKSILIVDDVMTTGATSSEISKVLVEHGAKLCNVFTFAHSYTAKENVELFKSISLTNNLKQS